MNSLVFLEEKNLPNTPFLMMIVTKDGRQLPYCVSIVRRGKITGGTMLLGEFLQTLTKCPSKIFNLDPASTANQRHYIKNEAAFGWENDVLCYRRILPGEISKLRRKILLFTVKDTCLENPKDNEEIKKRFIELSHYL